MAFDTKQLRTCKELVKLTKVPRGLISAPKIFEDTIFCRFGRFYATSGYVLAYVEWSEYQHAGDEGWCTLARFMDDGGKLVKFEFEPCEELHSDNYFEKHFVEKVYYGDCLPVNPKLLTGVLRLFVINDLMPIMVRDGSKWQLSAHNDDISIKAIVMGVRK